MKSGHTFSVRPITSSATPILACRLARDTLASTDTPGEPYGNLIGMTVILCAFYDGMTMIHARKKGPLVR